MNITNFLNTNTEKFPLKSAIGFKKKDEWKEISWKMFRTMVFKTANALRNSGIQENDKVAIYSDNSAEWITFDLAILSLGAITVPIYATNNKEQTQYIIDDSEAKMILVGNQEQYDIVYEILQEKSSLCNIIVAKKMVWLKDNIGVYLEDFIEKHSDELDIVPKTLDDLATIIYTSGTTGTPKGVMLSHGNFKNVFDAHYDFFNFKNFEKEHSLAFLPLTHIFERCWSIFCLYGGAKVSFLENPKSIAHALTEVRPTMMCAVPRFYQKIYTGVNDMVEKSSKIKKKIFAWALKQGTSVSEYIRRGEKIPIALSIKNGIADKLIFSKIRKKMGGNLWFMPCGGASILPEITRFFDAMGIHITVGYGLTETTATLTASPFKNYEHGSAGIMMGDTQIKIGADNEILAKGSGIMKGYYKKPEETASVFTEDGWFKTGDAGVLDEKGNLIITDRIKDLMKTSNGKYVAPQPIENLLSNNGFIQQVMVVAEGRPFVTALLVPNFEALSEKLKSFNIPMTNWKDIVKTDKIKDFYTEIINDIQKGLSGFERVKKFTLMPMEFEISAGEITPTLKIKRNIILSKYADLIEEMYKY